MLNLNEIKSLIQECKDKASTQEELLKCELLNVSQPYIVDLTGTCWCEVGGVYQLEINEMDIKIILYVDLYYFMQEENIEKLITKVSLGSGVDFINKVYEINYVVSSTKMAKQFGLQEFRIWEPCRDYYNFKHIKFDINIDFGSYEINMDYIASIDMLSNFSNIDIKCGMFTLDVGDIKEFMQKNIKVHALCYLYRCEFNEQTVDFLDKLFEILQDKYIDSRIELYFDNTKLMIKREILNWFEKYVQKLVSKNYRESKVHIILMRQRVHFNRNQFYTGGEWKQYGIYDSTFLNSISNFSKYFDIMLAC